MKRIIFFLLLVLLFAESALSQISSNNVYAYYCAHDAQLQQSMNINGTPYSIVSYCGNTIYMVFTVSNIESAMKILKEKSSCLKLTYQYSKDGFSYYGSPKVKGMYAFKSDKSLINYLPSSINLDSYSYTQISLSDIGGTNNITGGTNNIQIGRASVGNSTQEQQKTKPCPICKGTRRKEVNKSLSVPHYGLTCTHDYVTCKECGYRYRSCSLYHYHEDCKVCNGKGYVNDYR